MKMTAKIQCLYEKISDASASRDQLHVWTNYPSNKRTDRLPSVILPVSPMQCYLERKKQKKQPQTYIGFEKPPEVD